MGQAAKQKHNKAGDTKPRNGVLSRQDYDKELRRLQVELVQLEEWVRSRGLRAVAIFEGRDTAGNSRVIKRITAVLNPRVLRVVPLPAPPHRATTQCLIP